VGFKAIVWDFDGVLIDSEPLHIEAEIETFGKFNIKPPVSVMKQYLGIKLKDYFADMAQQYGLLEKLGDMIQAHYETLIRYYGEVFPLNPHALEVLEKLSASYDMAIATSRERELAQLSMARWSLDSYFKAVVYGDEVETGKPHPEPYLRACEKLSVAPSNAAAVEDAEAGFASAGEAGLYVIALKWEHNREMDFSRADAVVEDLLEIPDLLMSM
jgi:HAD superfamily hydrolase (TIGR01509 family)